MIIELLPCLMANVVDDCGTICGQKPRYRYEEILWKKVQEIIDLLNSIEPEVKK